MNKPWFKQLGYSYNPFTIKPAFFDDEIHGYDAQIDKLVERLQDRNMCFLEGRYGLGKTSITQYLINELKGKYKILYVSRNRNDRALDYTQLLKGASKGLSKLVGKKARNVILFVDETEKINDKDCNQIKELFDQGYFLSVLFIDHDFKEARFNDAIRTEIGKKITVIKPISEDDAVALVRSRLDGNEQLITDELIVAIFKASERNTRSFLLHMEDVVRKVIDAGRDKVLAKDVNDFFGTELVKEKKVAAKKKSTKKKSAKKAATKKASTKKSAAKESKEQDATQKGSQPKTSEKGSAPKKQAAKPVAIQERSARAKKADANLIAFSEPHEVAHILQKFGKRQTQENQDKLKSIGLAWKKDKSMPSHTREAFYDFVEETDALKDLE